ncbi:collagen-like protein [Tenacibaculum jejuense]|uniref:Probable lipoprotein n=1 Tax=Tenacibaculum jejuense TaxID=584609 RepID=A0A238U9I6_9FLAO|nr:collagen-like protein [Tenacibaculum jejuense]SNR15134.1 Probable lipoprotein precursor [Tenacibaculum jejuense]
MKKTKFKISYLLIMLVLICNFSCSSEDGMDGIDGMQGPQGEQGLPGTDGKDGNANVIVKTVDNVVWTVGSFLGQEANLFEINDTDITQEVLDNSLILVYFKLVTGEAWYPMTYAFPFDNGNDEVITFTYELNKINIYALKSTGPLNASIDDIRYFIIEGNSAVASREDLSKLSYEEALKRFKLLE